MRFFQALLVATFLLQSVTASALVDERAVRRWATETELLAYPARDGTIAYALDTDSTYVRSNGDWVAVGTNQVEKIRFCGNGHDGSTAHYIGPVLLDDTEADLAYGGAGCDALDNATEATADAPYHAAFAFKPIAMACVMECTGATTADDDVTFQLRDDTADVADMSCDITLAGDATPAQCTVDDGNPSTVAAGSALAIEVTGEDDVCDDAGDDVECLVWVTF